MNAYYNEHDPFAAAWLRELIRDGLIPAGDVDERDIQLVQPADLAGYEQCHFFAGIGGWAYALQLAGWSGPVWTGSCPCQPFSAAGKGAGFDDPRHLWPSWFRLIRECRPPVVFGEQVASADGLAWFDTVSTDLEAEAYAVGAADLAAASVGAPHLRQRLFFVADSKRSGERYASREVGRAKRQEEGRQPKPGDAALPVEQWCSTGLVADSRRGQLRDQRHQVAGPPGGPARQAHQRERLRVDARHGGRTGVALGDTLKPGLEGLAGDGDDRHESGRQRARAARSATATGCVGVGLADTNSRRRRERCERHRREAQLGQSAPQRDNAGGCNPWVDLEWLPCTDGKARPTQPGLFPLAHGIPNRVGTLRGAGNAIVPQVAAQFIRAYLEALR